MGQCYHPDFDNVLKGEACETSDDEIMAAVRKILTAEEVYHPEIHEAPAAQPEGAQPAKPSLFSSLLSRFRG
jgi:hypothetical protein